VGRDSRPGRLAHAWEFFDGSTESDDACPYQLYYHRVYADTLPEEAFLICRGGTSATKPTSA
jgi:hypothetical protein